MKKQMKIICVAVGVWMLAGCGISSDSAVSTHTVTQNAVNQVIQDQINQNEAKQNQELQADSVYAETYHDKKNSEKSQATDIDYDLTQMSSDMVYATVYQMMNYPNAYIRNSFRMQGNYYSILANGNRYHYCVIQDATACCAQGMEFVWEDGSHKYPDEYPAKDTVVTITGRFETYTENGSNALYCRLKDAILEYSDTN